MAIKKGLTPHLAEIGKIKIGGKGEKTVSKNGKSFCLPKKFNHFVVTTTEKDETGNFIIDEKIMQVLGDKPTEIPIRLPFDDIDLNFYTSFQYYHSKKLICNGDGETATRINKDGIKKEVTCYPEKCEFLQSSRCKVSGILSCYLPSSMLVGGIYRFRTHSWNSVSGILAALNYFSKNTNGILQGLPLKLKFLKKHTEDHGSVGIVTILLDGIELQKMRSLACDEISDRKKLGIDILSIQDNARVSGFLDSTDDPADVEEEFYNPIEYQDDEKKGSTSQDIADMLENAKEEITQEYLEEEEKNINKDKKEEALF